MKQSARILLVSVQALSLVMRWIAFAAVVLLMVITVVSVVSRWLGYPVLGAGELIEHTMVVLIAFALAYAQAQRSHISINLIVDRLPSPIRLGVNIAATLLVAATAFTIAWIYVQENVAQDTSASTSTGLLDLPSLPFKVALAMGFAAWGLNALLQVFDPDAMRARGHGTELSELEAKQ